MDWSQEIIKSASTFVAGILTGLVYPQIQKKIADRKTKLEEGKRKRQILQHLDDISSDIIAAVRVEPHGVQNKDKWVTRLGEFTKQYDQLLGPLAGYVKRIAYRIDDSSFDHANPSNPPYCCDQVIEDFTLLRLCILPLVAEEMAWDSAKVEVMEKEHLRKIWASFQEVGRPAPLNHPNPKQWYEDYATQHTNQWYTEWKDKTFRIGENNLVMAPYVNHERRGQ